MDKLDKAIGETVTDVIRSAIGTATLERLKGYNSPLSKIIDDVVAANSGTIRGILQEAITDKANNAEFRAEVKSSFMHSLARVLMNEFKGEIEKQAHALRQNPEFRANVVLAINNVVKEHAK